MYYPPLISLQAGNSSQESKKKYSKPPYRWKIKTIESIFSFVVFASCCISAEKLQDKTSVNCSCREPTASSCLCLPIPEPGHELSCFVEGTERLMNASVTSEATTLQLLNRSFQTQLERKFCGQLSRSDQCQSKTKGNMKEFLTQIRKSYQEINKSKA
ncbi:interleukin-9 [Apteryx mantelli]|uniref:Interleukin-9 n=1 Tax=Apteryx mantelli TaxID=2696672 RepID=A0ABM4F876_9AVES